MIKQHWWKILAVILLLYVFIVGLISPLSPGITSALPSVANTGKSVILDVEGYNTFFAEGENSAWLKLDAAHELCSENITVIDNNNLKITFQLPNTLPTIDKNAPATLIVNNTTEGYAIYPDAISIRVNEDIDSANTVEWGICENKVLTESTTFDFPFRNVLVETIRNLYFHVPFWFGMLFIFLAAAINSILYLSRSFNMKYDIRAKALVQVGLLFGIIGIVTGGIWAQYTWGAFWSFDIKQNMSAIALLIYMAYFVLRSSFDDEQQQARLSAIYNIFAFVSLVPLLFIIPRMYDSLHPGNGGNPAFGSEDLDNTMRMVFYPAVIGWTLLGFWIANLLARMGNIKMWWIEQLDD